MTEGPILKKLVRFMLPLCIINVVQMLYNAIDVAILGNFGGDDAVAAVGAAGSLSYILTGLFQGLGGGVNVVVSRAVGAKDIDRARRATGTALLTGIICGCILLAVVMPMAPTLLTWMNCDPEVLDLSVLYMRVLFLSMPLNMLYNFVASAIRATGNCTRPMMIMLISGAGKVGFNFLLVGGFKMGVVGAALSSVLSMTIAFSLVLFTIIRTKDAPYTLERKNLRIRGDLLKNMVRFGLPGGVSSMCFYAANAVIQTAVNSMGKTVMAANTVASQFDSIIYTVGTAIAISTMAFVGQNMGARKPDRIKKVVGVAIVLATVISLTMGVIFVAFSDQLCGTITDSPEVIEIAKTRMTLLCLTYFTSSIMEVLAVSLSSMGHYKNHLAVGITCGLGARVLWVKLFWPMFGTLFGLYLSFPVSNLLAIAEYATVFLISIPRLKAKFAKEDAEKALKEAQSLQS